MQNLNTNLPATPKPPSWYRHRWPWLLMLGPILVIVAGSYTMWLAFKHEDAMVIDDYYKEGRAINQDLRRDHIASSLKLTLHLAYNARLSLLNGQVQSFGIPMPGKLQLRLVHPTRPEKDIYSQVQTDNQGNFSIALPMLEATRWRVQLENEQRDWRLTGLWMWPQQQMIDISAD